MEAAMEQVQDKYEFHVRWEPFLLRPDMPEDGVPKAALGHQAVGERLKKAGEAVGIDFTGKCDRYPNTLAAHAAMELAGEVEGGRYQNDLAEALFQAYFTDGRYPDAAAMVDIAAGVGLDGAAVQAVVTDQGRLAMTRQKAIGWRSQMVTGVPYFLMNGQKVFSGAQDEATFLRMFEIVTERFPLTAGPTAQM